MNNLAFSAILMGLGTTLTFDLWALFLKYAFKITPANISLVGRWLRCMAEGTFTHLRGLERTFGLSRQTVAEWLKKASQLPPLAETLRASEPDDGLELDELWSFVGCKVNKRWIWIAYMHKYYIYCFLSF